MSVSLRLGERNALLDGPREADIKLLLTHGAGGGIEDKGLQALCAALAENGVLCVRFELDYRAQGRKSPPKAERSIPGFIEASELAKEEFGEGVWIVGGRSYGGRVGSMAVAQGMRAAGLLLLAYPLHAPGRREVLRTAHWPQIAIPTLFVQGSSDPFCDLDLLESSLPLLETPARVEIVSGGDHSLRVAAARSPDGKAASEQQTAVRLADHVLSWLSSL